MIATAEGCGTQTQVLLAKAKEILGGIYAGIFKKGAPTSLRALVEAFDAAEDPFAEYGRDRTRSGATMALTLALAHGIKGISRKLLPPTRRGPTGRR